MYCYVLSPRSSLTWRSTGVERVCCGRWPRTSRVKCSRARLTPYSDLTDWAIAKQTDRREQFDRWDEPTFSQCIIMSCDTRSSCVVLIVARNVSRTLRAIFRVRRVQTSHFRRFESSGSMYIPPERVDLIRVQYDARPSVVDVMLTDQMQTADNHVVMFTVSICGRYQRYPIILTKLLLCRFVFSRADLSIMLLLLYVCVCPCVTKSARRAVAEPWSREFSFLPRLKGECIEFKEV